MQSKHDVIWLTLNQRKDIPPVGFEEMRDRIKKILDDLRDYAASASRKNPWTYSIYGTVANIHGGDILRQKYPFHDCVNIDGTRSELADFELIDADVEPHYCRYHVHMAIFAKPGQSVADYIMSAWKWGDKDSVCKKYGAAVYDIDGVFDYIDVNHEWSQRKCRFARHYPSSGRVSYDAAKAEIREGFEILTRKTHDPEGGAELDGATACDIPQEHQDIRL